MPEKLDHKRPGSHYTMSLKPVYLLLLITISYATVYGNGLLQPELLTDEPEMEVGTMKQDGAPVTLAWMNGSSSAHYVIQHITLEGNHTTRASTIMREIPFAAGDSLSGDRLATRLVQARLNLMNTGLFNFVETEMQILHSHHVALTFHFVERWNIWPLPVLELEEPNLNQWLDDPSFSALNYGISLRAYNLTGRNESIHLGARAGNVQSLHLRLNTPYFGRGQSVRAELQYSLDRSKRRAYGTKDNEQLIARLADEFISQEYAFSGALRLRPGFYNTHLFSLSFHYHHYADTLLELNPRFGPDGKSSFSFFSAGYTFRHDRRDIIVYPLEGYLVEAGITQNGLGLLSEENMRVTSLFASLRHYAKLADQWYTAWSAYGKWSEGTTLSYFDREGLGFSHSLVRGYEHYVIDGHKFFIFKTNLKYNLLPERVTEISVIPVESLSRIHYALYLNVFTDVGIMDDRHYLSTNNLANRWLAATGIGLDLHTYYDIVLRSEFSLNRHGETGLFFHLSAPI